MTNQQEETFEERFDAVWYSTQSPNRSDVLKLFTEELTRIIEKSDEAKRENHYLDVSCPTCGHIPQRDRHLCENKEE